MANSYFKQQQGGQDRINWYEQFTAQFDPQGVVEIAFNTDETFDNIMFV